LKLIEVRVHLYLIRILIGHRLECIW
jgi:hypothetical protein